MDDIQVSCDASVGRTNNLLPAYDVGSESESSVDSVFTESRSDDESDATVELCTVALIIRHPKWNPFRPRNVEIKMWEFCVPFTDETVARDIDSALGKHLEERFRKGGVWVVRYMQQAVGQWHVRIFPHPLARGGQNLNPFTIEDLATEHGTIGIQVDLTVPWYLNFRNVMKGLMTFAAISLLADLVLLVAILVLTDFEPRLLIIEAAVAKPLIAILCGIACHMAIRICHGAHVTDEQDHHVYGGILCLCTGGL